MSVLLVEDDDVIRIALIDAMTNAGFEVIEAVDSEPARALAGTTPCPELIVSDINVGAGMDGFALDAALQCRWQAVRQSRLPWTHSCSTSSTWQGAPAALCEPAPLSGPV